MINHANTLWNIRNEANNIGQAMEGQGYTYAEVEDYFYKVYDPIRRAADCAAIHLGQLGHGYYGSKYTRAQIEELGADCCKQQSSEHRLIRLSTGEWTYP